MRRATRLAGTIVVLCVAATGASAAERYYAYARVPTLDYQRQHVVDQTGQQAFDGVCAVWEPGWETSVDYVPLEAENVMRWYTGLGYAIDASSKTVTFKSFSAPMVADKDGARRRIGPDQMVPNFSVTAPLTTVRPAGCSDNWVKVWTQNEYVATHGYPPSVGPPSGQSAPAESDISKSIINGVRQRVEQEQQNRSLCGNPGGCGE